MKYKVFNKETAQEIKEIFIDPEGNIYKYFWENFGGIKRYYLSRLDLAAWALCRFTGFYTEDKQEIYENMRLVVNIDEKILYGTVYPSDNNQFILYFGHGEYRFLSKIHNNAKLHGWEFDNKFFPLGDKNAPSKTDCTKSHQEDKIAPETITINFDSPFSQENVVIVPPSKKTLGEMMEEAFEDHIVSLMKEWISIIEEKISNFAILEKRMKDLEDGETTDIERLDQKIKALLKRFNKLEPRIKELEDTY